MENRDWTQLYRITKSLNLFLEPVDLELLNEIFNSYTTFNFPPNLIQSTYVFEMVRFNWGFFYDSERFLSDYIADAFKFHNGASGNVFNIE